MASGDDRCRSSGLATRRDQLPRRGIRVGALAKRNPNACTNTRFGVPICSLPDVLRRPPMHTGRKSWELLLRNRTWDARRATVGPHLAAISGKLRSLRVSAIGVCSTAPTGRGILPSWPCEFDSRHPLHVKAKSRAPFAMPPRFCVTARRAGPLRVPGGGGTNWPLSPSFRSASMCLMMTDSPNSPVVHANV